jgi:hypothetical protein
LIRGGSFQPWEPHERDERLVHASLFDVSATGSIVNPGASVTIGTPGLWALGAAAASLLDALRSV